MDSEFEAIRKALLGEAPKGQFVGWLNQRGVRVSKSPIRDIIDRIVYIRSRERIMSLAVRIRMESSGDLAYQKTRDQLSALARELLAAINETPEQEVSPEGG